MPIHDWTRVDPGIFHDFHGTWISEIKRALNRGLLPPDYYALAEQVTGPFGPDVLTLRTPASPARGAPNTAGLGGGVAVAEVPPRVRFHATAESDAYGTKAKAVVIRHRSNHQVVAIAEIVSPGNKDSRQKLDAFVRKTWDALEAGVHLLVVDLFPPGARDPQGIHPAIWQDRGGEEGDDAFALPADKPLTCAAYVGGPLPQAFVDPVGIGDPLPDMPLFLTPEVYVPVPLNTTYQSAWDSVPAFWQDVLTARPTG